jgi:magnesium transporter
MPRIGVARHPDGTLEEALGPAELARLLAVEGAVGWLDLEAPTADEVQALEGPFGLHHLALEDAQNPETRPKIEEYDGFLFVVTRGPNHEREGSAVELVPLFVFLNRRVIVTIHDRPMHSVATAHERLRKHPELLRHGPDRLLHHLLDQVVDHYFPLVEALEERIEALETQVFRAVDTRLLEDIFATRKEVAALRRSLGPLREVVSNLTGGVPYVDDDLRPFFRDVYDHVLRLLEELETNRDILAGLLESYLSQASNRMNAVMKRLTALATIGLPFTIVSGYFGMNFEVMPWLSEPWGVIAATLTMIGMAAGAYCVFRWRGWL